MPRGRAVDLVVRVLVVFIRAYRLALSPFFGPSCRFEPSCSRYAETALFVHGVRRGGWLAVTRICRCHPWNAGGLDPVPELTGVHG